MRRSGALGASRSGAFASYALSKSLSGISFTNGDLARPEDQYNRRAEKGSSDCDVPQRLAVSFGYDVPLVANTRLPGGWGGTGIDI